MKTTFGILLIVLLSGCNNNSHISASPTATPTSIATVVPTAVPTVAPTAAPTAIPNPNLICDGSFEGIYSGSSWEVFDYLSLPENCWKIKDVKAGLEVQFSGVTKPAVHGNYIAELDSHKVNGLTKSNVEIYQILKTVPGQSYDLTFYYAARTSNSSSNMDVTIAEVNGITLTTTTLKHYSSTNSNFAKYSIKFVATSCETYVSFKGTGTEDSFGALLDAVVLKKYIPNIDCDCN